MDTCRRNGQFYSVRKELAGELAQQGLNGPLRSVRVGPTWLSVRLRNHPVNSLTSDRNSCGRDTWRPLRNRGPRRTSTYAHRGRQGEAATHCTALAL
eukprot:3786179-Pyramimonas_sp.AAC.1